MATMTVRKLPHPVWQYAIPAAIAVVCGVLIGVMVTRGGGGSSKKTAVIAQTEIPAASSAPAVSAPAPAPAPAQSAAAIVTASPILATPATPTTNVTFETTPRGATVTLVDNGKPSYIGTTPVEATIDSTHRYDIVYTMDGYRTRVTALDPTTTHRAEARLDAVGNGHPDRRASTQRQRHHH